MPDILLAFDLLRRKNSFRMIPNYAFGSRGDVRLHAFGRRRGLLPDPPYIARTAYPLKPSSTPRVFVGIRFTPGRRWLSQEALSRIEASDGRSIDNAFHAGLLVRQNSLRDTDLAKAGFTSLLSLANEKLEMEVFDPDFIEACGELFSSVAGKAVRAVGGNGARKFNKLNQMIMVVEISLQSREWKIIRLNLLMERLTKVTPPLGCGDGGYNQERCAICLERFDDDDDDDDQQQQQEQEQEQEQDQDQEEKEGRGGIVRVWCKHVYHEECLRNWLMRKSTCPLCRAHVLPPTRRRDDDCSGRID